MRNALGWAAVMVGVVVAAAALTAVVARFADGPIGPFPGGALVGEIDPTPDPDWANVGDTLEIQVSPDSPRSVRTAAVVHDGKLYVPSFWAERKTWPQEAVADPRVVVRVGGRLYERQAVRVTDPAERAAVTAAMARTHGYQPDGVVAAPGTWYFRLDQRPAAPPS